MPQEARHKPVAPLAAVLNTFRLNGRLHARMDADKLLYVLDDFILRDEKTKKPAPNILNVTLNRPAIFGNHVRATLGSASQQLKINTADDDHDKNQAVELFLNSVLGGAGKVGRAVELLINADETTLDDNNNEQVTIRGRVAVRTTMTMVDGELIPTILPLDSRYLTYETTTRGVLWFAYSTFRTAADINDEYPDAKLPEPPGAGLKLYEIVDYWDAKSNFVYTGASTSERGRLVLIGGNDRARGRVIHSAENKYEDPPLDLYTVPLGSGLRDSDRNEHRGESIFFLIRKAMPEMNRLVTLLQTSNANAVLSALMYKSSAGEAGKITESPYGAGKIASVEKDGGFEIIPTGDISRAGQLVYNILTSDLDAGSLPLTEVGLSNQPLSAVALIQLGEGNNQVLVPRLGAKGMVMQGVARRVITQTKKVAGIAGVSTFKLGSPGQMDTFKVADLEGLYDLTYVYTVKDPRTDLGRAGIAEAMRPWLDKDTIREETLQLADPEKVRRKKLVEDAEEQSPILRQFNTVLALIEEGEELQAFMLAQEWVTTVKALLGGAPPPQQAPALTPEPGALEGQPAANFKPLVENTLAASSTRAEQLTQQIPESATQGGQ